MTLVINDACSKWIEVTPTNGSTSAIMIEHLRTLFSRTGIPEVIVSNNASYLVAVPSLSSTAGSSKYEGEVTILSEIGTLAGSGSSLRILT